MTLKPELRQQLKNIFLILLKVWLIYLIVIGLIIGIGKLVYHIPIGDFTRDPNWTLDGAFYIGSISNLGVILWTAAATICILSFVYLKRYNRDSHLRLFMLHSSILTTLLLLDDLYMWHEQMFPDYLGISQKLVYVIYFIYAVFYLIRFRKTIFQTEYVILATAILFLGSSVFVDIVNGNHRFTARILKLTGLSFSQFDEINVFIEDAFKGLGILTWLIYFSRVTFMNVLPSAKSETETSTRR